MHPFTPMKVNANDAGNSPNVIWGEGSDLPNCITQATVIHMVGHLPASIGSEVIHAVLGKNWGQDTWRWTGCSVLCPLFRWKQAWLKAKIWTIPGLSLLRSRVQVRTCEQSLLVCKQREWDGSHTYSGVTPKWHCRHPHGVRVRSSVWVNIFCNVVILSTGCYLMLVLKSVNGIKMLNLYSSPSHSQPRPAELHLEQAFVQLPLSSSVLTPSLLLGPEHFWKSGQSFKVCPIKRAENFYSLFSPVVIDWLSWKYCWNVTAVGVVVHSPQSWDKECCCPILPPIQNTLLHQKKCHD